METEARGLVWLATLFVVVALALLSNMGCAVHLQEHEVVAEDEPLDGTDPAAIDPRPVVGHAAPLRPDEPAGTVAEPGPEEDDPACFHVATVACETFDADGRAEVMDCFACMRGDAWERVCGDCGAAPPGGGGARPSMNGAM